MDNKILISDSNLRGITREMVQDLLNKIKNKDLSLPYTTQITKSTYLKVDGNGNMFLCNNGQYISIPDMTKSNVDINEIYKIFNIATIENYWTTGEITLPPSGGFDTYGRVIEYNGKIYCIGGYRSTLNQIYDMNTKTWSTGAPMPAGLSFFGIQQYNGKIYCIGGVNRMNNSIYNSVYIYDALSNSWSSGLVIPRGKQSFACSISMGRIYCIGGYISLSTSPYFGPDNSNYSYDISSNTWGTLRILPEPIYNMGFSQLFYGNNTYIIGGIIGGSATNKMYIYDKVNNVWSTGPTIPTARNALSCILYNSRIYAIGASDSTTAGKKIELFDIITNKWSSLTDMINSKSGTNLVLYNDKICSFYGTLMETLYPKYNSYNIPIPSYINEKLSEILSNGDGTKIFHNDGKYRNITPNYEVLSSDQVNDILDYAFL